MTSVTWFCDCGASREKSKTSSAFTPQVSPLGAERQKRFPPSTEGSGSLCLNVPGPCTPCPLSQLHAPPASLPQLQGAFPQGVCRDPPPASEGGLWPAPPEALSPRPPPRALEAGGCAPVQGVFYYLMSSEDRKQRRTETISPLRCTTGLGGIQRQGGGTSNCRLMPYRCIKMRMHEVPAGTPLGAQAWGGLAGIRHLHLQPARPAGPRGPASLCLKVGGRSSPWVLTRVLPGGVSPHVNTSKRNSVGAQTPPCWLPPGSQVRGGFCWRRSDVLCKPFACQAEKGRLGSSVSPSAPTFVSPAILSGFREHLREHTQGGLRLLLEKTFRITRLRKRNRKLL